MNGTMLQGFSWHLPADGQHWLRVAEQAELFAKAGITAVWLPPAYKGQAGKNDVGYGVYDTYDLGEFDQKDTVATKYGTRAEYQAAIDAIHANGMEVLADVVLDHRIGADGTERVEATEVSQANRNQAVSSQHPITAWTRFWYPGRAGKYSEFAWDWNCFLGTDYDEETKRNSIYLFHGKRWAGRAEQVATGAYDYLMGDVVDLMYQPVYDELERWGEWYVNGSNLDGFRLDAIRHMDRQFYLNWLSDLRRATGRELFSVGADSSPDVRELQEYLGSERCMSLFDVPLYYRLYAASKNEGGIDLSRILDNTLVQKDPVHAVTFVASRDTQPGQALLGFVEPWFKPSAYALILLRQDGYPCVSYGDLFGLPGEGGPAVPELPVLMDLRRRFAYGTQRDYLDEPDIIGWTREGEPDHGDLGLACILSERDGGAKTMCVGRIHAGERWVSVLGEGHSTVIGEDGTATFACGSDKLCVYVRQGDAPFVS